VFDKFGFETDETIRVNCWGSGKDLSLLD